MSYSLLLEQDNVALLRLDVGGSAHKNPDGKQIQTPHLHVRSYKGKMRWAEKIPDGVFSDLSDAQKTLLDFMQYVNIQEKVCV